MSTLSRLYTFVPFTTIASAEVNAELNQIINLLNGTDLVKGLYLRTNGSANPLADPALLVNGQIYVESFSASGAVIRIFHSSDPTNPMIDISNLGWIKLRAGSQGVTPSAQFMYASGCLYSNSTNVGNVGAGEDNLNTFTLGANVFGTSSGLTHAKVHYRGYTAANGNNKRLKFYCKTTVVMDSGVMTENNKPFELDAIVIPDTDGVSTVTISGIFRCGATEVRFNTNVTGYDFAVDNVWKMTAEAVATDDIVNNIMIVDIGRGLN